MIFISGSKRGYEVFPRLAIHKAASHGGKSLIGKFQSFPSRFDETLRDMQIEEMEPRGLSGDRSFHV